MTDSASSVNTGDEFAEEEPIDTGIDTTSDTTDTDLATDYSTEELPADNAENQPTEELPVEDGGEETKSSKKSPKSKQTDSVKSEPKDEDQSMTEFFKGRTFKIEYKLSTGKDATPKDLDFETLLTQYKKAKSKELYLLSKFLYF